MYRTDELEKAFLQMFCEADFLLLYDQENSYLWKYRKEILDCINVAKDKQLFNSTSELVNQFKEYERRLEIIKEDNKSLSISNDSISAENSKLKKK